VHVTSKWEYTTIGEAAEFTSKPRGLRHTELIRIPFVPMTVIPVGGTYVQDHIWKSGKDIRSGNYFEKGDCLIAKITPCFENGKQGIARDLPANFGFASTELVPFRGRDGISNKYFLFYFLLEATTRRQIAQKMEGATGRQRIPISVLKSWPITLPSLPEQKKIAAVLLKIQRAIETQEKIIQTLCDLKKSTMQHLFTHGLCGEKTKMTKIGEIPESWDVVKVGNVCESSAFGPRFSADLYSPEGDVLTLRTTDISNDGRIDYAQAPKANLDMRRFENHLLQIGDCVVTRSGTCGIAAVFEGCEMPVLPGAFLIRVRLGSEMHPHFFRYYVNSLAGRSRILKIARGAIQKNISGTSLLAFEVPLANIDEQRNLVESLSTVDAKLYAHESKKSALKDLLKTTLNKLITGEIRVTNLDIGVREVDV
jgi:type I restriction enzyme S subunit